MGAREKTYFCASFVPGDDEQVPYKRRFCPEPIM